MFGPRGPLLFLGQKVAHIGSAPCQHLVVEGLFAVQIFQRALQPGHLLLQRLASLGQNDLALRDGRLPPQAQLHIVLHLQRGVVVIPKSTHVERMRENLDVFGFSLSREEMEAIAALDKKQSAFFSHQDPNMVEWFVEMVEQRRGRQGGSAAE